MTQNGVKIDWALTQQEKYDEFDMRETRTCKV